MLLPFVFAQLLLAQSVIDSATVEWVFAHWQQLGIGGIAAALAWRNRSTIAGWLKTKAADTPALDAEDHRAQLFAAVCLLSDHAIATGNAAAQKACEELVTVCMMPCDKAPPEPTPIQ